MTASRLVAQATAVLFGNLSLTNDEELLVVSDETVSSELVEAIRCAASAAGIRSYLFVYEPLNSRPMSEVGLFGGASMRREGVPLPRGLEQALRSCPVIALANSDQDFLSFSPVFKQILADGARAASLTYLTTESALRLLPATISEVAALAALTDRGGAAIASATHARVTSTGGTDVAMKLGQYDGRIHNGIVARGKRQSLPAGQVTRVPDDGSANGTIVIDRTIGANDYKQLTEPVRFTVRDGYVTAVDGGLEAAKIRRWLAAQDSREIYHVTELAFGTNSRCSLSGVAAPCEDTHTAGCVSFALGADVHIGGNTSAPAHVDMTMREATLELDGTAVVRAGALAI